MTQPSVLYKGNSVHILLPGLPKANQGGEASGQGNKNWTMMNNVYSLYLSNPLSNSQGLLMHELCHNLGLHHPCAGVGCAETPSSTPPGYGNCSPPCDPALYTCSNNIMDYNPLRTGLARCQVMRMHETLLGFYPGENIRDCVRDVITPKTPTMGGPTCNIRHYFYWL